MSSYIYKANRLFIALFVIGLLGPGCSGSNSSNAENLPQDVAVSVDASDTSDNSNDNGIDITPEDQNPSTPDSMELELTRVTFEITVPMFVSDTLRVRLLWGELDTTAMWVEDESWVISEELPSNTEHPLTVTFGDGNGSITLGTFEADYRTGTDDAESFQISAEQFDTVRWDSDGDGVSNLEESILGTNPLGGGTLVPVLARFELVPDKTFRISWDTTVEAEFYRVLENVDGISGFNPVSEDLDATTRVFEHRVALYNRVNARYIVQNCNSDMCLDSNELTVTGTLEAAIGLLRPDDLDLVDSLGNMYPRFFGSSHSFSADGKTLAVSALGSTSTQLLGDNFDPDNTIIKRSGAVYVFFRTATGWQQQAQLKASNANEDDVFGFGGIRLSADGNTLAIVASGEDSAATGINGSQDDNSAEDSGAVYVFERNAGNWQQQAYLKASNTDAGDFFGNGLSISADGDTLAVGATGEDSVVTGINGNGSDNSSEGSGAVYIFRRTDGSWQQKAYIKDSNATASAHFGHPLNLSGDGNTLVVGGTRSAAVSTFSYSNGVWQHTDSFDVRSSGRTIGIGPPISLSADGTTLAVGARHDNSGSTGINGDQSDSSSINSGAVYVFTRNNETWQEESYIKASVTGSRDFFGEKVQLSSDGNTLVIAAPWESSNAIGVNGNAYENSDHQRGAVYVFLRTSGIWRQQAFLKRGSAMDRLSSFGKFVSVSADGNTVAIAGSKGLYLY